MQPNTLLLKDFYRRWSWAYLLGFLAFFGVGAGFAVSKNHSMLPLGGGAILSAVLLATDLNFRTNARTLLSLPVRLKEIGLTFWLICVPFSALFVTMATTLGSTIAAILGAKNPLDTGELFRMLYLSGAVNAIMLLTLTYLPHRQPENAAEQVTGGIAGGVWGLGVGASFSAPMFWPKSIPLQQSITITLLLLGAISAVAAWHRCATMLLNRTAPASGTTKKTERSYSLPSGGLSGLPWLFLRTLGLSCGFSLVMQVFMHLTFRLLSAPHNSATVPMQILFPMFFISILILLPNMTALRHLRSLPLSAKQLALLFLALPAVSLTGIFLPTPLYALFGMEFSARWSNPNLLVFGIGMFCLFLSLMLNIGVKWGIAGVILVVPAITFFAMMKQVLDISWDIFTSPFTPFLGLGLLLGAYRWNLHAIRHRSKIYLPHFHLVGRNQFGG
jgi:hypothetical protein